MMNKYIFESIKDISPCEDIFLKKVLKWKTIDSSDRYVDQATVSSAMKSNLYLETVIMVTFKFLYTAWCTTEAK